MTPGLQNPGRDCRKLSVILEKGRKSIVIYFLFLEKYFMILMR
jgi:hypothetical protein